MSAQLQRMLCKSTESAEQAVTITLDDTKDQTDYTLTIRIKCLLSKDTTDSQNDQEVYERALKYFDAKDLESLSSEKNLQSPELHIDSLTVQGVLTLWFDQPMAVPAVPVDYSECISVKLI